jgi:3'-phosphoadenosine 5'-phosphosulfate sulfotransferase (PAPS reductase)/FAD synthetase
MALNVISYGGGIQSTALLVLAAKGELNEIFGGEVKHFLFANTGDDSEHPKTLEFVRTVAIPYAKAHNLEIHELSRTLRDGTTETLYGRIANPNRKAYVIPVRLSNGAPASRHCTVDFKIDVVNKWLKKNGATKDEPAKVGIGISVDEIERAGRGKDEPYTRRIYPLLHLGLRRDNCEVIIRESGLPVPPKSSCYFCPWHSKKHWSEMRRDEPELFAKSVELEKIINEKNKASGAQPTYLTDLKKPLDEGIAEAQDALFDVNDGIFNGGECDSGVCWV